MSIFSRKLNTIANNTNSYLKSFFVKQKSICSSQYWALSTGFLPQKNFAGSSFVNLEDFGTLQYGSELMNIVFDPTVDNQLASYNYDDGGMPALQDVPQRTARCEAAERFALP